MDAQSPKIIALAQWAVDEHNKDTTAKVAFVKVISATEQVEYDTINYTITLEIRHLVLRLPNMDIEAKVSVSGDSKTLVEFRTIGPSAA